MHHFFFAALNRWLLMSAEKFECVWHFNAVLNFTIFDYKTSLFAENTFPIKSISIAHLNKQLFYGQTHKQFEKAICTNKTQTTNKYFRRFSTFPWIHLCLCFHEYSCLAGWLCLHLCFNCAAGKKGIDFHSDAALQFVSSARYIWRENDRTG